MAIGSKDNTAQGIKTELNKDSTSRQKVINGLSEKHGDELKSAVGKKSTPPQPGSAPHTPPTSGKP